MGCRRRNFVEEEGKPSNLVTGMMLSCQTQRPAPYSSQQLGHRHARAQRTAGRSSRCPGGVVIYTRLMRGSSMMMAGPGINEETNIQSCCGLAVAGC
jgi:hypothetical protein